MNPTFAEVTVSKRTAADIFINNERKGIGTRKDAYARQFTP
jgi:hypothetical protein